MQNTHEHPLPAVHPVRLTWHPVRERYTAAVAWFGSFSSELLEFVMGLASVHRGASLPLQNKVVLVGPDGEVRFSYRKTYPAAGWETGSAPERY